MDNDKFYFAIDRGGTFTDVFARCPGGKIEILKLLSEDKRYSDAPAEGIRRILQQESNVKMEEKLDTSRIGWIRMGTTVATNALLERKGARMALIVNEGLEGLLDIGNQSRPDIFDLKVLMPDVVFERVIEAECRVIPALPEKCQLKHEPTWRKVKGSTGEEFIVIKELNEEKLKTNLQELCRSGIKSLAVALVHSFAYPDHEIQIGKLAKEIGFLQISLSHEVMPMVKIIPRSFTTCADAYLTPHIKSYLQTFSSEFQDKLKNVNVLFMQSDGGLTPMNSFSGSRAILSGPAGGVVGYAITTYGKETDLPVIGFDMGGTSTDVSRYAGSYEHVFEGMTAGIVIQAPQLDINTVAAGGGSMLFFESNLFKVGPESAGADPGPACYRRGGPLTVTDANLLLGRLDVDSFPHIFGPERNKPLDVNIVKKLFDELTEKINKHHKNIMTPIQVAMGFIKVANETMCRPIRALTEAKGHDTSHHVLACFGGAGGQHACAIARTLGIKTVFIHKYASILSAYGMVLADVVEEIQEPSAEVYCEESFALLDNRMDEMETKVRKKLRAQGFADSQIHIEPFLNLRYEGTDCALMCSPECEDITKIKAGSATRRGDFLASFLKRYKTEFGFTISGRKILVNDVRIRAVGKTDIMDDPATSLSEDKPQFEKLVSIYFEDSYRHDVGVYKMKSLLPGNTVQGPALLIDNMSTILVEPDCTACVTSRGDVKITIGKGPISQISTDLNTVHLSIFSHRFMSIAEQMGRVLQRTAISTNIKERLDFSCAIFGPDGGLVSNAPHIPVHLGSMQETVQYQIKAFQNSFKKGDMILSNHPKAGGSHLPDLTVITPVFYRYLPSPVFFVASRGHHADIGGITPGSMPPHSKSLSDEGATFESFLLVQDGVFQEEALTRAFMEPGKLPGNSGTRNLENNISDLKAQIAANQKGIKLVNELIEFYSLEVVQAYMNHIQRAAEDAVREMFKKKAAEISKNFTDTIYGSDYLDDGSLIALRVKFDAETGEADFDFSGTSEEVLGNWNAPRAITMSAIIYCLRSMINKDIPLNQGCLNPVRVKIPAGSLLDPSDGAAVVGGNVLTSQRIVDVILRAFNVCAASQGCMNNVTFGNEEWGYYETVAGGSGAGFMWQGKSGVHTHMTNTRITDPEILELRYPVVLKIFKIRKGSGGRGLYRGGDGVVREIMFRAPVTLSVLTERRVIQPYGMCGGENGQCGKNYLVIGEKKFYLGPKSCTEVKPHESFFMLTPGGGGYGIEQPSEDSTCSESTTTKEKIFKDLKQVRSSGSLSQYRQIQESA
ncbi:5-oxoprolinase [Pseudomyrmex gracilis]|uniref:5-oxoprolinase n=1 Tax=Pseudomyrmex gracilis TaxID=219809 RepID=UPI000994BB5A|nr:5-oxoprolinase [Pseudomyrmex gracilis]